MLEQRHRIGYVDGLRAVAVLSVVASHSYPPVSIGQSFGVDLFFVISGFCLAFPTLAKLGKSGTAGFDVYRYAAHRVVRIVPPYYICVAVLAIGAAFAIPGINRASVLDVARQMLFLDNHTTFLTPSFWSLSVEFRWYFLFPLALLLWVKAPRAFLAVVVLCVIAGQATMAMSSDVFALPAFLLGIVAAHVRVWGHRLERFALPACLAMLVVAYLKTGTLLSPFWEVAVFLLVVAAGAESWLSRVLSMKWLAGIGLASYSIYLVQGPVIQFLQDEHRSIAVCVFASIAAGFVFWFVVERPFLVGGVRAKLIQEFTAAFAKYGALLGIPRDVALAHAPAAAGRSVEGALAQLRSTHDPVPS